MTGSNEGSSDDPKFALLLWFREIVSLQLRRLSEKEASMKATDQFFKGITLDLIEIKPLWFPVPPPFFHRNPQQFHEWFISMRSSVIPLKNCSVAFILASFSDNLLNCRENNLLVILRNFNAET